MTHRSLIGLKRKASFKATNKKGVAASTSDALRAAVAAVAQFSTTVSESLDSTYRSLADTLRLSIAGGGARTAPGPGSSHDGTASTLTFSAR